LDFGKLATFGRKIRQKGAEIAVLAAQFLCQEKLKLDEYTY
jgi:hypothetical protein